MAVPDELYDLLATVAGTDRVDDTNLPDSYLVGATPAIVYSLVSDVPETVIDGEIIGRTQRWQVSTYSTDLANARTVAAAVRTELHGATTATIQRIDFDNSQELCDGNPRQYHIPSDFILML